MANENSSGWIVEGRERALDLSLLHQDKDRIYDGLDRIALPTPHRYEFDCVDVLSDKVAELFRNPTSPGYHFFVRLIPRFGGQRPYKEEVKTFQELRDFCSLYDLRDFASRMVKWENEITHTGSIIATDISPGVSGECVVETADCGGHDFFHGKVTPTHAKISIGPRIIKFSEEDLPKNLKEDELRLALEAQRIRRSLALRALRMIGGPRHPFPGYYEFSVCNGDILFRNYQSRDSVYGDLWVSPPEVRESNENLNGD
ncbi:MAG TPA: hypothetical protein VJA47_05590 [archaeon]|nr:hypothetical protein [archaeon]